MKKAGIFLVFFIALFISIFLLRLNSFSRAIPIATDLEEGDYSNPKGEEDLRSFIEEHFFMEERSLIRTSFLEENLMATGDEVLSESLAIYMEYSYEKGDGEAFYEAVEVLRALFIDKEGLIRWKISGAENRNLKAAINAPVDDLRIIRNLYLAGQSFEEEGYLLLADELSTALFKHNVREHRVLTFNDPKARYAPLVYHDFLALAIMAERDSRWNRVLRESLQVTKNQRISGLPFFYDDYWIEEGIVSLEEFMVLENLWVFYYLSKVGIKDQEALLWIIDSMDRGPILGRYQIEEDRFFGHESPAIYGVIAKIARIYHDQELYLLSMEALDRMVVKEGAYRGGFVDLLQGQAYSYDQLVPLLSY